MNAPLEGSLKLNYLMFLNLGFITAIPFYTYHTAVSNHQEPPFPHATITNTSCHYPQAQFFRAFMTQSIAFLTLIFWVVFNWFQMQVRKWEYPDNAYVYMKWPTILSSFGLLIAIGTIDIGGYGSAHVIGAIFYFALLYFMVVNFTVISHKMRQWDIRSMSEKSLMLKRIIAAYLSAIWFYCLFGYLLENSNDNDKYIVILEWNIYYGGLLWVASFYQEWKCYYITLRKRN